MDFILQKQLSLHNKAKFHANKGSYEEKQQNIYI